MRKLECSTTMTIEKTAGPRLRLLNPRERPLAEHVRLRRHYEGRALEAESRAFYRPVATSGDVPIVAYGPALEEPDKKARLLVARIAAVGAAWAIGFLAFDLILNS